jgi:predicted metal-binding membrane protein
MVLLAAFGVMNLWAMVGLAAVVTAEKLARRGPVFARVVGIASIALAIAVFRVPGPAPGLTSGDMGGIHSA